jgi:hypothetical protein
MEGISSQLIKLVTFSGPCLPSPVSGVRFSPFPDAREPGVMVHHAKEVFITQKKLLDKAVLILKYNKPNDL